MIGDDKDMKIEDVLRIRCPKCGQVVLRTQTKCPVCKNELKVLTDAEFAEVKETIARRLAKEAAVRDAAAVNCERELLKRRRALIGATMMLMLALLLLVASGLGLFR